MAGYNYRVHEKKVNKLAFRSFFLKILKRKARQITEFVISVMGPQEATEEMSYCIASILKKAREALTQSSDT